MRNLYADIGAFRRRFVNNIPLDEQDATEALHVLEAASRRCDEFTHRQFFSETATRYYDGSGCGELWIDDLLAATSVKLDEDGDRTFEVTLSAAADYYLLRKGHRDESALPSTLLRLDPVNGQRGLFIERPRLVEIAGRWGFTETVERIAPQITLADVTTAVATLSEPGDVADGQTLKTSTGEQVFVRHGGGTTSLTVDRGVNGSTAGAVTNSTLDRYVYVPQVVDATLILAARMWKRRETAYANVIAAPALGTFETFRRTDPDAAELLLPLVRQDRVA